MKSNVPYTSGKLLSHTYNRELRHIPQDCNYITFSNVSTWNLRT